jgi:hypothetical protein
MKNLKQLWSGFLERFELPQHIAFLRAQSGSLNFYLERGGITVFLHPGKPGNCIMTSGTKLADVMAASKKKLEAWKIENGASL